MDLKSGYPYWAVKNGLLYAFPQLDTDLSCDVVVIGAGITGALIADELATHGHDAVVGGENENCDMQARRDNLVDRQTTIFLPKVARLFPKCQAKPAFAWADTFAESTQ